MDWKVVEIRPKRKPTNDEQDKKWREKRETFVHALRKQIEQARTQIPLRHFRRNPGEFTNDLVTYNIQPREIGSGWREIHLCERNTMIAHLRQMVVDMRRADLLLTNVIGEVAHLQEMRRQYHIPFREIQTDQTELNTFIRFHRLERAKMHLRTLRDSSDSLMERARILSEIRLEIKEGKITPEEVRLHLGELEFARRRIIEGVRTFWKKILSETDVATRRESVRTLLNLLAVIDARPNDIGTSLGEINRYRL